MPLRDWFEERRQKKDVQQLSTTLGNEHLSESDIEKLWKQCYQCSAQIPTKELEANLSVCPKCHYHFRVGAPVRIGQLFDSFDEHDSEMSASDPLTFTDLEPYAKRIVSAKQKTARKEAIITGRGVIRGLEGEQAMAVAVMDFDFMGGSMGSVVGEKLTRTIEYALQEQLPLVVITSSGGARMQEGIFSLMQMVKTGAALAKLHEAGLLYITILTEPTFGGVTASYGMLGDILIAEDGARIGFAGRRVIEQTIRQKLPPEFQTADYLKQYGQLDMVVDRFSLKAQLAHVIRLHTRASALAGPVASRRLG
jgi:acetyl-CoA carboxylase carboxyl transferase subunit beta